MGGFCNGMELARGVSVTKAFTIPFEFVKATSNVVNYSLLSSAWAESRLSFLELNIPDTSKMFLFQGESSFLGFQCPKYTPER